MNNDTQVLDRNPVSVPVSGSQVQPQMGSLNKEAPIAATGLSEIRPSGPEVRHEISQESAELGVKEIQDRPDLVQTVDIHHAGPHVPVPSSPSGKVIMPMSEEEITDKLKTGQDDDSGKWLAGLIQKIIKAMGL